jgi:hypothetical protein
MVPAARLASHRSALMPSVVTSPGDGAAATVDVGAADPGESEVDEPESSPPHAVGTRTAKDSNEAAMVRWRAMREPPRTEQMDGLCQRTKG